MENNKMNRREAIRAMMLAGAGLAAGTSLNHDLTPKPTGTIEWE